MIMGQFFIIYSYTSCLISVEDETPPVAPLRILKAVSSARLLGDGYVLNFRRGYSLKVVEFRVRRRQSVVVERKRGIHIQASLSSERPEHFIAHFADAFREVDEGLCTPPNCYPHRVKFRMNPA